MRDIPQVDGSSDEQPCGRKQTAACISSVALDKNSEALSVSVATSVSAPITRRSHIGVDAPKRQVRTNDLRIFRKNCRRPHGKRRLKNLC